MRSGDAPSGKRGTTQPGDELQPLMQEFRKRLRSSNPWDLLAFVSAVVSVAYHPPGDEEPVGVHGLVESFIGVDLAETTAALKVLSVLVPEDDVVSDVREELTHRTQPMPLWLRDIDEARVARAAVMSDDSGRGENVVLGITWAGGDESTFTTYVDHVAGTVVKDAFPLPIPVSETLERMLSYAEDEEGVELEDLDLAEARALIEDALDTGDALDVEFESDSWPSSRPILEWLLTTLPDAGPRRRGLDPDAFAQSVLAQRADLLEQFVTSKEAEKVGLELTEDGVDDLALTLVAGSGPLLSEDEFLRWTPERVDELLLLSLPASALVDRAIANRLSELLEAFATWCLGHVGAGAQEIAAVRRAVGAAATEFLAIATSHEAAALRDAIRAYGRRIGNDEIAMPILEAHDEIDLDRWVLEYRAREVGGIEALMSLETDPLPDEPFDWPVVPEDIRGPVDEVLVLMDEFADRFFDVEYRTACRRFLAAVVASDPAIFRRRGSAASLAGTAAWLVGRSTGLVAHGGTSLPAGKLWAHFGLKGASTRADTLRRAVGVDTYELRESLGRPEWLTSERRQELVRLRDELV